MDKRIINLIAAAAVCTVANAQPKSGGRCPAPIYARDFSKMEVLDTTQVRVRYAFCAERIDDPKTYIDLQRLDVGQRVVKYYSEFVYQSDSLRTKYAKEHPNAQAAPSWMGVMSRDYDQWSEYEWSDFFFENGQLTEYSQMPQWLHKDNSWYTEPAPRQAWKLSTIATSTEGTETQTILGHKCQRATCRFRGRDFVAWFAPDIPVRCGPWKFQGLPGLILKVYDTDGLYSFEAVGIETRPHPITRFIEYKNYHRSTRERVWKMQRQYHENWFKAVDYHKGHVDSAGNMVDDGPMSVFTKYNPLELE